MVEFCDFAQLRMGWRPNRHLMLPPGFDSPARAHQASRVLREPPEALFRRLKAIIDEEPRIRWLAEDRTGLRLELIQRSRVFRFPDRVSIAIAPRADGSAPAVYSRAMLGVWDFGVNRARVRRWAKALETGRPDPSARIRFPRIRLPRIRSYSSWNILSLTKRPVDEMSSPTPSIVLQAASPPAAEPRNNRAKTT